MEPCSHKQSMRSRLAVKCLKRPITWLRRLLPIKCTGYGTCLRSVFCVLCSVRVGVLTARCNTLFCKVPSIQHASARARVRTFIPSLKRAGGGCEVRANTHGCCAACYFTSFDISYEDLMHEPEVVWPKVMAFVGSDCNRHVMGKVAGGEWCKGKPSISSTSRSFSIGVRVVYHHAVRRTGHVVLLFYLRPLMRSLLQCFRLLVFSSSSRQWLFSDGMCADIRAAC